VLANATMSIAQVVSIVMRVEEEKKREVWVKRQVPEFAPFS
jgi:hypothetical protein